MQSDKAVESSTLNIKAGEAQSESQNIKAARLVSRKNNIKHTVKAQLVVILCMMKDINIIAWYNSFFP